MHIEIPRGAETFVKSRSLAAGFETVEEYIYSLILKDEARGAPAEEFGEEALARSLAMIDKSMEDIQAGHTSLAKIALQNIAAEFDLTINR